jgi:hypothetical protein
MARAPHTALLISREDAEQRIRQRIDLAKTVLPGDRWSADELHASVEREWAWRAYNRKLLARIFSTDEFAKEYDLAAVPIYQTSDRYFDVDSNTIAGRVLGSVHNQVARLESIIDRLELIDEGTVEVASPLDKSKVREVGFAVVLLTPDDLGKAVDDDEERARARQNVIFELGYFVGALGRGKACLLRKGDVEIPSDLYGVVYTTMDSGNGWKLDLARELKDAGFEFNPAKILA